MGRYRRRQQFRHPHIRADDRWRSLSCLAKYLQWRARYQVVAHHAWAEQVGIVGRALACWRRCAYSTRWSRSSLERHARGQLRPAADDRLYRDVSLTSTRMSGAVGHSTTGRPSRYWTVLNSGATG